MVGGLPGGQVAAGDTTFHRFVRKWCILILPSPSLEPPLTLSLHRSYPLLDELVSLPPPLHFSSFRPKHPDLLCCSFTPTIVQTFGYTTVQTQLLTVPPFVLAFIVTLIVAWFSDRYGRRGLSAIAMSVLALAGYISTFDLFPLKRTS